MSARGFGLCAVAVKILLLLILASILNRPDAPAPRAAADPPRERSARNAPPPIADAGGARAGARALNAGARAP